MRTSNKNSETQKHEKFAKEIVAQIETEFLKRQQERRFLERQWQVNMDFFNGKQYVGVTRSGEIAESIREYDWEARGVFNHISPIIEARLAKLSLVRPVLSVRPSSDDAKEIDNASLAEALLSSTFNKLKFGNTVSEVTRWSEICGTGFYKVTWDNDGGDTVGTTPDGKIFEGEVKILPVSPFEIFPDSLSRRSVEDCSSIIHAQKLSSGEISSLYGVEIEGESKTFIEDDRKKKNSDGLITVLEYYEKPSEEFEQGRLITVAGGVLLFYGDLPYLNGDYDKREYPFVRHVCAEAVGEFFGKSIIERLIPVQRAYNAVKNRKHEFMNRITMGIMTVEDGSMDVDDLAEEGLMPGKILIYRQGSKAPEIMKESTLPQIFNEEEEKLLNEFVIVSGVSDIMSSATENGVTSGTALEILISQYNERLLVSAEEIRSVFVNVAKHTLRLYKQFMTDIRAIKNIDADSKNKIFYVDKGVMTADDVYVDSENELIYTQKQKKEMLLDLYKSGLLNNAEGKISSTTKEKLLSLLGYKSLDNTGELVKLQREKAKYENEKIIKGEIINIEPVDDDEVHIEEHSRYYLSEVEKLSAIEKENILRHIALHKKGVLATEN